VEILQAFPIGEILVALHTYRAPPQHTTMGPHRKLRIYVGYQSPSIIKYLEPFIGDIFTTWYADSIFDEDHFLALGEEILYHTNNVIKLIRIPYPSPTIIHILHNLNFKFRKIINFQHIANNTPDTFPNYKGITKSYNPA
jgi:hypothetical protein